MEAGQDMEMIFYTVDAIEMRLLVIDDTPYVFEHLLPPLFPQHGFAILGGENYVVINLGVG